MKKMQVNLKVKHERAPEEGVCGYGMVGVRAHV